MSSQANSLDEIYDFSNRSAVRASVVWGLAAVFYLYELMLLVSPSVMHDDLTLAFDTTAEQLGNLAAFYYYAYAAMQIPVGLLMDKYGPRILLATASLFCCLGCFVFGSAQVLWAAELGRFIMGIGGSFAVVGCLKLASLWFPVNRFALLTGLMVAVGMMGGVFGQAPVAKLVIAFGWQQTIFMGAVLGAILSAIIWFVVSDFPPNAPIKQAMSENIYSEKLTLWAQFILVVLLFLIPFWSVNSFQFNSIVEQILFVTVFYMGWVLSHRLKKIYELPNPLRSAIALVSLLTLFAVGYNLGFSGNELLSFSFGLGFFSRMCFQKQCPIPRGLYTIMRSPQVWFASLYAGLMFVPTTGFGQLWGVPYFSERYDIGKDVSGLLVSMIFFGWALGGPLFGWVSDRIGRRKIPMGIAAVATLCVMLAILFLPVSINVMRILMFLLGAFSSGFILAFSVVREINAPLLTGTAIGFINTLNNASGALAQPIVGKVLDYLWDGSLRADGSPLYSLASYNQALMFLPVCLLVALILVPIIKETFCRPMVTKLEE